MLCSLAVDLRVTQLVDGTKGVHAMVAEVDFRQVDSEPEGTA